VSSQVYGLIVDVLQQDAMAYIPAILEDVNAGITSSAQTFAALCDAREDQMDVDVAWQAPYHALSALAKVLRVSPGHSTQKDKIHWAEIIAHLLFPHSWVRTVSCRLVGMLFAAVPPERSRDEFPEDSPLSRQGLRDLADKLCTQLKGEHLDAALSLQVVENLFHIGKCFCLISAMDVPESVLDVESEEEPRVNLKAEHPLPWLFSKLSYQARSAYIARRNRSFSKVSCFFFLASNLWPCHRRRATGRNSL